jgi:cupin 2 domain-containing protein
MDNLFADLAPPQEGERFDELLRHKGLVIERIISSSRIAHERYVQAQDEWVVLLQGTATLDVDGHTVELNAGSYLFLPAHTPHTVVQVSDGALWLAVHLHPAP